MWPGGLSDVDFEEAVQYFLGRVTMTEAEYRALEVGARKRAFAVAGIAQLDLVDDAWRALDKALAAGTTLEDFKSEVGAKLRAAWAGDVKNPGWRLETVFRTNVQVAYSAGRYRQLTDPDTREDRPFWMFDAVLDGRETKVCRDCDGTILPQDHAFWASHQPPLHFNCRSSVIALTEEQAKARGGVAATPPATPADTGFGAPPGADDWAPDPAKYEPALWRALQKKQPPADPAHTPEHWTERYERYGEAKGTVAWGRAAEERGLDLPLAAIERALKPVERHPVVARALNLVDLAKAEGQKPATLRDLIVWAGRLRKVPEHAPEALRVAAALAGHIDKVEAGKYSPRVSYPRMPAKKTTAEATFARAKGFFEAVLSKELTTGPLKVGFVENHQRGYFDPRARSIRSPTRGNLLEHETGHALEEFNPTLLERARAFLRTRTAGEEPQSLAKLTGAAFQPHEQARPDAFRDPYVGKLYERGDTVVATEVTSMGLEWLASREAAAFLAWDPEHFWFVLGQLARR